MQLSSLLGHTQELFGLIRSSRKPADSVIDSYFRIRRYLGSHDRRFIAETTYGTLRHLRSCETRVDQILRGFDGAEADDRSLLAVTAYLFHHEHRTDLTAEVVAAKIRSAAVKSGLPEILLRLSGSTIPDAQEQGPLAVRYSFPDWMMERFLAQFGLNETRKLCESLNQSAPLTLRVNTLKTTVEECQGRLRTEGIETTQTSLSPAGLTVPKRVNIFALQSFRDGWFEVQDEGSQLLPLLIDPKPTWKVLDACAGAGGKSLALAALMKNRGEVFATDVQAFRLEELRKRARRAGASNVRVSLVEDFASKHPWTQGYFDSVFVDAPCSGVGTIRRNPGLKWVVEEKVVDELREKQLRILSSNTKFVKPAGSLMYATCSLFREENEDVVERFLGAHSDFSMEDIGPRAEKAGIGDAVDGSFVKLLPHRHGTDGFFCATLVKRDQ
ncbi:MAG: methyltransferase domain-containing protein [Ignavibacteriales bacterium]|nr:methyltransferase domain-containing protein [Ignavibacteriales bacterium]